MTAARVVPALDEVEDRQASLGLGGEPLAIEQLALERGEEALAQGVVVGIPPRRSPNGRLDSAVIRGVSGGSRW